MGAARALVAAVILVLLGGCHTPSPAPDSGVKGTLYFVWTLGALPRHLQTSPPWKGFDPPPAPSAGQLVIRSAKGAPGERFAVGPDGRFRIPLPPGTYYVDARVAAAGSRDREEDTLSTVGTGRVVVRPHEFSILAPLVWVSSP